MTTISDLNYILNILEANEFDSRRHIEAFEDLSTEEERAQYIKSLTDRSQMLKNDSKSGDGVNKGTASTVKATKAAEELAKAEGVSLSAVTPNAEGKIGVEEVRAAVKKD